MRLLFQSTKPKTNFGVQKKVIFLPKHKHSSELTAIIAGNSTNIHFKGAKSDLRNRRRKLNLSTLRNTQKFHISINLPHIQNGFYIILTTTSNQQALNYSLTR